ncbi:farnesyl diphosphate synthase [Pelagicoccus sp. SDUM812003]|uniref:polyprenyl synthetase family protein n=1 Tax=Pelagicoccus sp. SDUM812003 TaxID=3041267 RepID=UPI00281001A0|nr:farnesyl diphosphate synthase [Pelagicoccus sp. SDUM812003]MDQ8202141.1 polyprenyl synthetase family protein [Pelagicoccus sp. SDUM812003]
MEFKEKLRAYQSQVESAIGEYLPAEGTRPSRIHQAMRYSMQAGGKRLRPVLVLSAAELFAGKTDPTPAAIAVECLHTYSLIHDDLPSIDNADLRRGAATSHKQFDEATAVLAGDALLTYAFQLIARHYKSQPSLCAGLVSELSETAGSERLIGGQVEDILGEGAPLSEDTLNFIHLNKTSALIECCLVMGGIIGEASDAQRDTLRAFGREIGIAFQIIDDILDATSDAETLGKNTGSDAELEKTTYVKLHGLQRSRDIAHQRTQKAIQLCQSLPGDTSFLVGLASYLENRIR